MSIEPQQHVVDYSIVEQIRSVVNAQLEEYHATHGPMSIDDQRQMAASLIARQLEAFTWDSVRGGRGVRSDAEERDISDAVLSRMFGLGRLEELFDIEDAEDIYINGTNPVVVKHFGGAKEVLPPIADSNEDLLAQINAIATHHGSGEREMTVARPFLDLDIKDRDARLAAMWILTPNPVVTIRRHRFVNVQLEHLVSWGTISRAMMAFLQAAVIGKRSILVVGSQSVGKTTMLRALCSCIPQWERFITMETEYELLLHTIPERFPLLIPIQERVGTGEVDLNGKPAGQIDVTDVFPRSLRHSAERVVLGETRSREIIALLRSMSRGYAGSMATFHADSARETFEALATLLIEHQPSLNHEAAMRQIATAIDIVVYLDRDTGIDPATGEMVEIRYVSEVLEVGGVTGDAPISASELFKPHEDPEARLLDPRGYPTGVALTDDLWARRAGLDPAWLNKKLGGWDRAFPIRTWAASYDQPTES